MVSGRNPNTVIPHIELMEVSLIPIADFDPRIINPLREFDGI